MKHLLAILSFLIATGIAQASEGIRVAPQLGLDGARVLLDEARAWATANDAPGGAIAVVDPAGVLISLDRLDGTFPAAPGIAIGKARTAALFRRATRDFENIVNQGRYTMLALPEITDFTPLQGGVPVYLNGEVIGAVGVSGAASAQQDDDIASAAVAAYTARQAAAAQAVTHRPAHEVEAAFLVDGMLVAGDAWRVNASRRDAPGEAEIHLTDTDIFYVLEGRAVFVTGGEMVDARQVSSHEIRGRALRNGVEHVLSRGDVITVPRGVPHWFSQVDAPFVYYVVKSTHHGG